MATPTRTSTAGATLRIHVEALEPDPARPDADARDALRPPVAAALALVGLIESLLTASIVDELTDTPSDKNRESRGQGSPTSWRACSAGWPCAR